MRTIYILLILLISSCDLGNSENNFEQINNATLYYSGYKKVVDSISNNYQEGSYVNGFKDGIWLYNINDTKWNKDWAIYKEIKNITINIPLDWEVLSDEKVQFSAKGEVSLNDSAQVVFHKVNIDTLLYDVDDYREGFFLDLSKNWEVIEATEECFVNLKDKFIISKFHLKKGQINYFCFSMIKKIGNEIIDLSYYFKSSKWISHYYVFFDFINGLKIKNEFITNHRVNEFDPLGFHICKEN